MGSKVILNDVGPRDGLQNQQKILSPEERVSLVRALLQAGLANVYASLESGIHKFDTSIAGLGGCPFAPGASGTVATEDVAIMLEQMDYDTGIDLDEILRASEQAQVLTGTAPGGRANAWLKRRSKRS
jgi:isopropylmalate/homocitrate/citramalate synthase